MKYVIYIFSLFLLSGVAVLAQDATCPNIVAEAINVTTDVCDGLRRNQACYGNLQIEAQFRDGMTDLTFEQAGDIVDVAAIERLRLSAMQSPDEWGVTLMSIQANLPDSIPGQNVTMLLFGGVTIENAGEAQPPSIDITLTGNANVRSGPGTGFGIVDGLVRDTTVMLIGRNEFGDWFQVQLPEERGTGWIYESSILTEDDLMMLDIVDPEFIDETGTEFGAMEAFFFRSSVIEPACAEAPQDGILIQTPSGVGEVTLLVNEVQIDLGSTIFVQAVPGDVMTVTLLEGTASVTAQGVTVGIPAGVQAQIPLDENGIANDAPELVAYDDTLTQAIPIEALPEDIVMAAAMTDEELDERVSIPTLTLWELRDTTDEEVFICPDGTIINNDLVVFREMMRTGNQIQWGELEMQMIAGNTYELTYQFEPGGNPDRPAESDMIVTILSPTQMQINEIQTFYYNDGLVCVTDEEIIATYAQDVTEDSVRGGTWTIAFAEERIQCPNGAGISLNTDEHVLTITENGFTYNDATFVQTNETSYTGVRNFDIETEQGTISVSRQFTLQQIAPGEIQGIENTVWDFPGDGPDCPFSVNFTMTFIEAQ